MGVGFIKQLPQPIDTAFARRLATRFLCGEHFLFE
jgi:hypothetical protein